MISGTFYITALFNHLFIH